MNRNLLLSLLLFCSLLSNSVYSQIFVGPNSFVFNKGSLIYVTNDVDLSTSTSNIYLRNEGQLLQGSVAVNGVNKGVGSLSVFQEGTSNNFGYNYWCSPVGIGLAAAGNNSFALNPVIKRPTGLTSFANPSYTSGYNGASTASLLTISTAWIYQYQSSVGYGYGPSGWDYKGETGAFQPGLGFTMKGVSGDDVTDIGEVSVNNPSGSGVLLDNQRYDFRGKPNDGTIQIPVSQTIGANTNNTLTGNPYPSAINLNMFLIENSGYTINNDGTYTNPIAPAAALGPINGIAYFWEHQKPATTHTIAGYIGGYGQYVPNNTNVNSPGVYNNAPWNTYNIDGTVNVQDVSPITTDLYKRMFSPVGQGFMVRGTQNGFASMKNKYRVFVKEGVSNHSQFERVSSETSTTESENWNVIHNVAGVDYTQFSKSQVPQIKIYTTINNQISREVTLAFNPNTTDGFDVAMEAISLDTTSPNDVFFSIAGNTNQFLVTTLPFNITKRVPFSLKAGASTTYKINVGKIINFTGSDNIFLYDGLTGVYHDIKNGFFEITLSEGMHTNRFEITFLNTALSADVNTINNFIIVQNNNNQLLSVANPNSLDLKSAYLFDISGKLIFKKVDLGSNSTYEFSTSTISDGVYLVKLETSDGKSTVQKIIVEKRK